MALDPLAATLLSTVWVPTSREDRGREQPGPAILDTGLARPSRFMKSPDATWDIGLRKWHGTMPQGPPLRLSQQGGG